MLENLEVKNKCGIVTEEGSTGCLTRATTHVNAKETGNNIRKTRVVSFRVTNEQYEGIQTMCTDDFGEKLVTIAEYARHSTLAQRVTKISENPLDRYRVAVAGEMATGITSIVQMMDELIDMTSDKFSIVDLMEVVKHLEAIQNKTELLLRPISAELSKEAIQ